MDVDYEGAAEIERAWREGLTPDPLLTVSEWSDRHRMLSSKASAEPGRWRTSRTPYLKAIMDCLSPTSPVERVVFMKAAQLGATEMGSNWIGYVIHHAPGPMMAVWPTVEMAKRNSKQRIDPLIEESGVLAELIAPARSRDSGNTILAKEFRGGVLVMTGANSAVGLRSMPVRYLFLDEVDGYPLDVEGEGDAISLAEARTRTFARRKIFIVSTPTISGASAIEREYEASDQRRYFVPCPHCSHRQWLRFEQLRWDKGAPETAAYVCESCDTAIAEHHKTWMLEHGEWRAMAEDGAPRTAGFHLSSLYSPVGWRAWRDIAAAWEAAVSKESGSAAAIKTFKNTELGETWVEEGEAPDWQRLVERREDYRIGSVPLGGLLLVGGADVQKDRIEVSVWAFGRGKEAWLVEHRVLMGDTAREQVWKRLAEMLDETWTHATGAAMPLARFALDTGFATQEAYAFVRACRDARVMAVKGASRGAALIGTPTAVDVSRDGKKLRRGIKVFTVAVGIAKLELYNNLRKAANVGEDGVTTTFPAGFVHLPKIDAEFTQQLCAEQLITRRDRNGLPCPSRAGERQCREGHPRAARPAGSLA
ncbi:phage terminase large subunit family protein [Burkholderia multivorans]|uniref:phage terminase large subunit family protein n=1 Tax=Burkholderia multivorans TaxID=87883 RepID=UPI002159056D